MGPVSSHPQHQVLLHSYQQPPQPKHQLLHQLHVITDGFTWQRPTPTGFKTTSCEFVCQHKKMETVNTRQNKWCNDDDALNSSIKANCCSSCNAGAKCM